MGKPRREDKVLVFRLPCGTIHREYGPAWQKGEIIIDKSYFLFGVQISQQLYRELTEATAAGGENMTFLFAKELIVRKPKTANQVRNVLERYYGHIGKIVAASAMLSL